MQPPADLVGIGRAGPVVDVGAEDLPAGLELGDDRLIWKGHRSILGWSGGNTAIVDPIAFRNAARDEVMLP